jgi:hypothetical protein
MGGKSCAIALVAVLMCVSLIFPSVSASSSWSDSRPTSTIVYDQRIENCAKSDAAVGLGVHIGTYVENDPVLGDYMTLRVATVANARAGITYGVSKTSDGTWNSASTATGLTSDNCGIWVPLPWAVTFFGVKYSMIWICSNGWLSFDYAGTESTPSEIGSVAKPNSLIAPFWRDLDVSMGGSITYLSANEWPYFVVSWNGVPNHLNGVVQTFQVVIEKKVPGVWDWPNNRIYFYYQQISKDYPTTVGIEDQTGSKQTGYPPQWLYNGAGVGFSCSDSPRHILGIRTYITKSDNTASIDIQETQLAAYNMKLVNSNDPYGDLYYTALSGGTTLLLDLSGFGGLIVDTTLIGLDMAHWFVGQYSPEAPDGVYDAKTSQNTAYVKATACDEKTGFLKATDCSMAFPILWIFKDQNTDTHKLTITSYVDWKQDGVSSELTLPISTSCTINLKVAAPPGCVAEGTQITMADWSTKPVERIRVGDQILGYDILTNSYVTETVMTVSSTKVPAVLNINSGELRTTPNDQPIYVRNSSCQGWVTDPSRIEIGWEVLDAANGVWVLVSIVEYEFNKTKVYDFQTDGPSTYLANGYLLLDKGKK